MSRSGSFNTEYDAAKSWSEHYRKSSRIFEHAGIIYSKVVDCKKTYYYGRTYAGMKSIGFIRANVLIPFICLYFLQSNIEWLKYRAKVEAFIHTHPEPAPKNTCRNHSKEDMMLFKLKRIKAIYVVPYENNEINREPNDGSDNGFD